jgi:hypothetical protein
LAERLQVQPHGVVALVTRYEALEWVKRVLLHLASLRRANTAQRWGCVRTFARSDASGRRRSCLRSQMR